MAKKKKRPYNRQKPTPVEATRGLEALGLSDVDEATLDEVDALLERSDELEIPENPTLQAKITLRLMLDQQAKFDMITKAIDDNTTQLELIGKTLFLVASQNQTQAGMFTDEQFSKLTQEAQYYKNAFEKLQIAYNELRTWAEKVVGGRNA